MVGVDRRDPRDVAVLRGPERDVRDWGPGAHAASLANRPALCNERAAIVATLLESDHSVAYRRTNRRSIRFFHHHTQAPATAKLPRDATAYRLPVAISASTCFCGT